jgi:hypothetical protein
MSVDIRRGKEIYGTDGGWFQARWHFSFDHYRDPGQMGVGALRVFNDDRLQVICRMPGNLVSPRPERLGISTGTRKAATGHQPPRISRRRPVSDRPRAATSDSSLALVGRFILRIQHRLSLWSRAAGRGGRSPRRTRV